MDGRKENTENMPLADAIMRLKAEVLAHDWSLNSRRILFLETAFATIAEAHCERKLQLAILTMASSVLAYIKVNENDFLPAALDFLKEAMARVISVHEDEGVDLRRDKVVFKEIYSRFQEVKKKISG